MGADREDDFGSLEIACSGDTASVAADVAAGITWVVNVGSVGTADCLVLVAACLLPPLAAPIIPSTTNTSMTVNILCHFIHAFTRCIVGNCGAVVNSVPDV